MSFLILKTKKTVAGSNQKVQNNFLSSCSGIKIPTRLVLRKEKNITFLGIHILVCINDSFCIYYRKQWAKYKKLHCNKLIYAV